MNRKLLLFAFLMLAACSITDAGIIRHVIKPVGKKVAGVSKTVVQKTVHGTKAVVY